MASLFEKCYTQKFSLGDAIVILPDEYSGCKTRYNPVGNIDEAGFIQYINDNNFVLAYRIISGYRHYSVTSVVRYPHCDTSIRPTCSEFSDAANLSSINITHAHYVGEDFCQRNINRHQGILSYTQINVSTDCSIVESESFLYSVSNCSFPQHMKSTWMAPASITADIEHYVPMPTGFTCPECHTLINGICVYDETLPGCQACPDCYTLVGEDCIADDCPEGEIHNPNATGPDDCCMDENCFTLGCLDSTAGGTVPCFSENIMDICITWTPYNPACIPPNEMDYIEINVVYSGNGADYISGPSIVHMPVGDYPWNTCFQVELLGTGSRGRTLAIDFPGYDICSGEPLEFELCFEDEDDPDPENPPGYVPPLEPIYDCCDWMPKDFMEWSNGWEMNQLIPPNQR